MGHNPLYKVPPTTKCSWPSPWQPGTQGSVMHKVQGCLWSLPWVPFWASVGKRVTDSPGPPSQRHLLHHIRVKLQEDPGHFQARLTSLPQLSPQQAPSCSPDMPCPGPAFTWPRCPLSRLWTTLPNSCYRTLPSCHISEKLSLKLPHPSWSSRPLCAPLPYPLDLFLVGTPSLQSG